MFSPADHRHMQRAIELAELGRFTTHPNPRVGCVIVRGEQAVGEGWHKTVGQAHAEVLALREAGDSARGATAYVTLEPHSFHGRTPPCTEALIRGGVPRVIVKVASSLDGRVALASGASRWITSEAARADVQRLRAAASAVVTGIGTVIADDPQLNVRDPSIDLAGRAMLRVVLDTRLRLPPSARLFSSDEPVLVATCDAGEREAELKHRGADVVRLKAASDGRVDLVELLRELGRRQCNDVLVEAGPILTSRLLDSNLCDELILYLAPRLLGGDAKPMVQLPGLQRLEDSVQFSVHALESVGPDVKLTLRPIASAR
jgi:diaminohydroxyphosphoribosylaminopyrimidine deaminase / 5-amino-6-(5-phosphoribosylamino)uracil reductase